MPTPARQTAADQIAAHLRAELARGRWVGTMPGQIRLARDLGVARNTVEAALRQLEREGLLENLGPGRRRRIANPSGKNRKALRGLRVAVLLVDVPDRRENISVELRHLLEEDGHIPFYPDETLLDLGTDLERVARLVERTKADAWIIGAGSREVLEWFSSQALPAFALFGHRKGLPIASAGPDKAPAFAEVAGRLAEFGHRRVVLLVRDQHRHPEPSPAARAFLDGLEAHGIQVGEFNLPHWKESKAGLGDLLDSLFRVTPPTAMLVDEAFLFNATYHFLASRGIRVPDEVSLVCTDGDPTFAWCEPSIAHIDWDHRPVLQRIVRWVATVSRGGRDLRQKLVRAKFVPGGTIGPAPEA